MKKYPQKLTLNSLILLGNSYLLSCGVGVGAQAGKCAHMYSATELHFRFQVNAL